VCLDLKGGKNLESYRVKSYVAILFQAGKVIDEMWLIKEKHGPYN
jgi:hypothetical protein